MTENSIVLSEVKGRVALLTINRPEALNALNIAVQKKMVELLKQHDQDSNISCIVITGSAKAFAAGADIKEMANKSASEMAELDFFAGWREVSTIRTPIIAAVSGYALGGGCELAMACDLVVAGESAKFGQPEIKLGIMPGMGGSQRLTKLVGRSKAMELILTGRNFTAAEAEAMGLVARIFPDAELLDKAMELASTIAGYGKHAVRAAKEAVNRAEEVSLHEGLLFERRLFHALFATHDQKEGMAAFSEKRTAKFTNS
ncbi:MAG: enoyl-CoA hydratase-related protein [Candidatus Pacebacteria bacterium]|nr:enoyl-CoA hydratase-related protein [Candidatus Paceibacterota bacterium]